MWGEGGRAGVSAGGARVEMGERGEFVGELAFSVSVFFFPVLFSIVVGSHHHHHPPPPTEYKYKALPLSLFIRVLAW